MGWVYLQKRDYDKAVEWGKQAITHRPNGAGVDARCARILNAVGRSEEAISFYENAMRLNPLAPSRFFIDLGMCYTFFGSF